MTTTAKLLSAILLSAAMAVSAQAATGHMSHHMGCLNCMRSADLEGKRVIGMNGRILGYILAVNERGGLVELQTRGGIAISLPESKLRVFGGMVYAPNVSQHQIQAMAKQQTGRTVALNIDMRHGNFRG